MERERREREGVERGKKLCERMRERREEREGENERRSRANAENMSDAGLEAHC